MCGFFLVIKNKEKIKKKNFLQSANLLKHRGPDHNSFFENKTIISKFFRLSIRDTSSNGNQPIIDKDKRYVMLFNGEIYNTDELSKKYNIKENSNSDTKLLFNIICKHKTKALKDIKGMFSIIFHDSHKNTTLLIRDRFGMKPLYYSKKKKKIIISSEIKPIIKFSNTRKMNENAIADFFLRGYMDHNDETFFKDIASVKPGCFIKIHKQKIKTYKYWQLKIKEDKETFVKSLSNIKKITKKSVFQHLISDRKIGFFLSGGNDSKTIVKISKNKIKKPNTITYEFKDNLKNKNNEFKNALNSISDNDKKFNYKVLIDKKKIEKKIQKLVYICEGPITSIRLIGVYESYKKAAQKSIKVILEGQCGDELLGGYLNNLIPSYLDKYDKKILNKKIYSKRNLKLFGEKKITQLLNCASNQGVCTSDGETYLNLNFFKKKFVKKFINKPFNISNLNVNYKNFNKLQKSQYLEYSLIHTPRSLKYVDRISMSHGVESRIPYLDHKLVEFCFNLSNNKKIKNNTQRYIFKKAFNLSDIKNKIEKKNITDPQRDWFKDKLNVLLKKQLKNISQNDKIFDKKNILNFLENYKKDEKLNSFGLMTIYTFLMFKKIFKLQY